MLESTRSLRSTHLVIGSAALGAVLAVLLHLPGTPAAATVVGLGLGCLLAVTAGFSKTCTP